MATPQSRKALDRARQLHQKGELGEAERLYLSVLQRDAAQVDALHGLGLLQARRGNFEHARQYVDRALGLRPDRAEIHFHRAEIVAALGLREQALDSYRQALVLQPDYFDALVNMGDQLLQMDRPAEALALFDRALVARPQDAAALNNRGNAMQALKRHDEALRCFDQALLQLPDHADVLNNRANALLSLGRFAEAEVAGRKALAVNPRHFHALVNLAKAQVAQGALAEGLARYEAALALRQDDADAWCDRGTILAELRRFEDALASNERALALDANLWNAWNERGKIFVLMGRVQDALRCYERALELRPGSAIASGNRAEALRALGRVSEARDAFDATLRADPAFAYAPGKVAALSMQMCDWRGVAAATRDILEGVRAGAPAADPLDLLLLTDAAHDQLHCARTYARDKYPRPEGPSWAAAGMRRGRIKVAYLSADFRDHPTSHLLAGLLERHDRARFDTFGLYFGPDERSPMAARMAAAFEHFLDVNRMSDDEVVKWLRASGIDIAVDLMGYTRFGRPAVFAARPCPVQVNYLGYPSTTGSDYIDYIIADAFVIPPGGESNYAERVVRLPDTFQANEPVARSLAEPPPRAALGLPERGLVFCSFNNNVKIAPEMFRAWMQILSRVGDSVLWLWSGSEAAKANLRREAASAGVDPSRLAFAPSVPYPEHLARLRQADLALDTLPFNGGATTSDALRSGVPVVTCPGEAFAARMSGSLLHAIGMPELITPSLDAYRALAIRLATDENLLAATKRKLAANRDTHALFDTDRFRRHLEAAYEIMWQRHQDGEPPADFDVQPVEPART